MTPREVVVVGGSIAALTAVQTLRMEDFDGRITVLSDEDVPPYTRVPLFKGVFAGTEPIAETMLAPLSDEVNLRLGTRATALDIDARLVHTTGPVRYDGLVIATGAGPPGRQAGPGRAGAPLAPGLRPAACQPRRAPLAGPGTIRHPPG